MQALLRIGSRLTEGVAAVMMAAIFLTFILQITIRYVVGSEWFLETFGGVINAAMFGWTVEFILVLWLWTIFWGNAFVVRETDHVTFDMVYNMVGSRTRKWFVIIGSVLICVAFIASIGPTYEKMRLLWLKSSATLPVKMLPIYSIYFLFLGAVAMRYAWRAWHTLRHGAPREDHIPQTEDVAR
ncbi:MAG: TRAP transporter small permease subunit [Alphaproteobacteria bacterium]